MCELVTIWELQLVRQLHILFISKHAIFSKVATCKLESNGKDISQKIFENFEKESSCRNHTGKSLWSPFFKKRTFLQEIQRNSLLTIAGLEPTSCNATKHQLLNKFFTGYLKILENFQEELRNKFLFNKLQVYKLQPSVLCFYKFWKIFQITSAVEFLYA